MAELHQQVAVVALHPTLTSDSLNTRNKEVLEAAIPTIHRRAVVQVDCIKLPAPQHIPRSASGSAV